MPDQALSGPGGGAAKAGDNALRGPARDWGTDHRSRPSAHRLVRREAFDQVGSNFDSGGGFASLSPHHRQAETALTSLGRRNRQEQLGAVFGPICFASTEGLG